MQIEEKRKLKKGIKKPVPNAFARQYGNGIFHK